MPTDAFDLYGTLTGYFAAERPDLAAVLDTAPPDLVHGYAALDRDVVESVLAERLDDLLDLSRSIRAGLGA